MRRRAPRPLGQALGSVLAASAPDTLLAEVQRVWPEVAGPALAAEARPERERDGTLTIACRSSTWAAELDLMQTQLLERLNAALGEPKLRALRFTATGG